MEIKKQPISFMIQLRESKAWQMLPCHHLQKVGSKFCVSVTLNGEREEEVRLSPPPLTKQGCVSETLWVDVGYLGLSKGMVYKRLINSHLMKLITKFLLLWSYVDPEEAKSCVFILSFWFNVLNNDAVFHFPSVKFWLAEAGHCTEYTHSPWSLWKSDLKTKGFMVL